MHSFALGIFSGFSQNAAIFTFSIFQRCKFESNKFEIYIQPASLFATEVLDLDLNFSCCSGLRDIADLGRGVGALRFLRHLRIDFSHCEALSDIRALGDGVGALHRSRKAAGLRPSVAACAKKEGHLGACSV